MQHDDVIWSVINTGHCSYRIKTKTHMFCRHPYNLTGFCGRGVCPLANSQYATVREEKGICYLYVKVVERAAFPERMWEKLKLSNSLPKALEQINEHLIYWPNFIKHKCKQRYMRIQQYLAKIRKLTLSSKKELVPLSRKVERREKGRERKALMAAKLDQSIEKSLAQKLKLSSGEEIVNVPELVFGRVASSVAAVKDQDDIEESDIEDEDIEEEEVEVNEDDVDVGRVHYVGDVDFSSSSEDEGDIEDIEDVVAPPLKQLRRQAEEASNSIRTAAKQHRRIQVEYELDDDAAARAAPQRRRQTLRR